MSVDYIAFEVDISTAVDTHSVEINQAVDADGVEINSVAELGAEINTWFTQEVGL